MNKILSKEVSYPLAKLLKGKEFDFFTKNHYFKDKLVVSDMVYKTNWNKFIDIDLDNDYYSAPTIAEVIDWIYEKHNIWISIASLSDCYIVKIYKKNNNIFCSIPPSINIFELYEKAIEYTLKKIL